VPRARDDGAEVYFREERIAVTATRVIVERRSFSSNDDSSGRVSYVVGAITSVIDLARHVRRDAAAEARR